MVILTNVLAIWVATLLRSRTRRVEMCKKASRAKIAERGKI
jgi:hypothetical protein